jgi:phosphoglycolate phosphatase-like HAD superfamily hydrolase
VRTDVGFDLDMTLVDSAAAIVDAVRFTCARFGVNADETAVRAGLGLPLDQVFPEWISDVPYDEALVIYRERYLDVGIDLTRALPGADAALASVRASGGSVLVVSAKHSTHVSASLAAVGLVADLRFGKGRGARTVRCGGLCRRSSRGCCWCAGGGCRGGRSADRADFGRRPARGRCTRGIANT